MKGDTSSHPVAQRHEDADGAMSDQGDPELPTYAESAAPLSSSTAPADIHEHALDATTAPPPPPPASHQQDALSRPLNPLGPTVSEPFNFPSVKESPPSYTPGGPDTGFSSSSAAAPEDARPIAIPQIAGTPQAPFLPAFAPSLLNYGIPAETWFSFLDTMSAFLTARVSSRALKHTGDIAASVGNVPVQLGKSVADTAKAKAKQIADSAKHGNIGGVIGGVIGGSIALTAGTAMKTVGSLLSLPGTAAQSAMSLKTPRERVEAYAAAVNRDWLHPRGLHMQIMAMSELSKSIGLGPAEILEMTGAAGSGAAATQMEALRHYIDNVQIRAASVTSTGGSGSGSGGSGGGSRPHASTRWSSSSSSQTKSGKQADKLGKSPSAGESSIAGSLAETTQASGESYLRLAPQTLWVVVRKQ